MQLTNLQLELLKIFRYEVNETQLAEIRDILADYFARKATAEMDKFWAENDWNDETVEKLSQEHLRTKYE